MKLRYITLLLVFFAIAGYALNARIQGPPARWSAQGTIKEVHGNRVVMLTTPSRGKKKSELLSFSVDPHATKFFHSEVTLDDYKVHEDAPHDLAADEFVMVECMGSRATKVHVAPTMIQGQITGRNGAAVDVMRPVVDQGPLEKHSYDLGDAKILLMGTAFDGLRPEARTVSDFNCGESARIFLDGGRVVAAQVLPPPPVTGTLTQVSATAIVVREDSQSSTRAASERRFRIDRDHVQLFNKYFATPLSEHASFEELEPGKKISVGVRGDEAIIIALHQKLINGKIKGVAGDDLVVDEGRKTEVFHLDHVRSEIGIGRLDYSTYRGNRNESIPVRYTLGAKASDLKVGDDIVLTAKGDTIMSIRVHPKRPTTRRGIQ